jgi:hypothetical protein
MSGVAPFFHLRIDGCATIERTRNNFRRLFRYPVKEMLATQLYTVVPSFTDVIDDRWANGSVPLGVGLESVCAWLGLGLRACPLMVRAGVSLGVVSEKDGADVVGESSNIRRGQSSLTGWSFLPLPGASSEELIFQ